MDIISFDSHKKYTLALDGEEMTRQAQSLERSQRLSAVTQSSPYKGGEKKRA